MKPQPTATMTFHSNHEKVFVSGSRALAQQGAGIRTQLEKIINKQLTVLVGDADGADKIVQTFLNDQGYPNVVVYCMDGVCRHNVGKWAEHSVDSEGHKRKDFKYFTMKDLKMSADADYGLMLWDSVSKGTLNNVLNMLESGKQSRVYVLEEDNIQSITTADKLVELVDKFAPNEKPIFDKKINLSKRIKKLQLPKQQQTPIQQEMKFQGQPAG